MKMMGFGDALFRSAQEDLVLFTFVGQGIGGADSLQRRSPGIANAAGEIGHLVDTSGPVCSCGMRGCLESFLCNPRIVERAKALYRKREAPIR